LETLREDLSQTRQQFQKLLEMQQQTQQRMEELQKKLESLEATQPGRPATAVAPPPAGAPTPPTTAQAPAPAPGGLPSALELARPREPFALYRDRGPGQLLFDMGISGDFVGDFTSTRVERARAGTFPDGENRFFPREIELSFFGQIDPYARGEVRVEAGEEFEDGGRTMNLSLAEAYLTLLALPFGTQS
jgi:hypothetical protein